MATKTTTANTLPKTLLKNLQALKDAPVQNMAQLTRLLRSVKESNAAFALADVLGNNGRPVSEAMNKQCKEWLLNLQFTPTGAYRKNAPLGNREEATAKNYGHAMFSDTYAVTSYHYAPVFDVYDSAGNYGFKYYLQGGIIHIIG